MKHHMTTWVSVPIDAEPHELFEAAVERLGGPDGVKLVSANLTDTHQCGTFVRNWETVDPTKAGEA